MSASTAALFGLIIGSLVTVAVAKLVARAERRRLQASLVEQSLDKALAALARAEGKAFKEAKRNIAVAEALIEAGTEAGGLPRRVAERVVVPYLVWADVFTDRAGAVSPRLISELRQAILGAAQAVEAAQVPTPWPLRRLPSPVFPTSREEYYRAVRDGDLARARFWRAEAIGARLVRHVRWGQRNWERLSAPKSAKKAAGKPPAPK